MQTMRQTPPSRRRVGPVALSSALLAVALVTPGSAASAASPRPVSPGTPDAMSRAASPCPTFSWTFDPAAGVIELAVYRLDAPDQDTPPEQAPPVLEESLPAGAVSWTPPADRCLEQGGRYAWFVRSEPAGAFELLGNREPYTWDTAFGAGSLVEGANFTTVRLAAPLVDLPDGAEVVDFRCVGYDNVEIDEAPGETDLDDLTLDMQLVRRNRSGTANEVMASALLRTEGANQTIQSDVALTILEPVINRSVYSYWIEGDYLAESKGRSLRFYGCELLLAIDHLNPL